MNSTRPEKFRLRSAVPAFLLVLLSAFPFTAAGVERNDSTPFYTRHLNPWVQVFGLPAAEGGWLAPPGRTETRLVLELGNESRGRRQGNELLFLDGETYRGTLVLRHGLGKRLEVGLDLPVVGHAGGALDNFIDGWHEFFDFPNSNRDDVKDNQLLYFYSRDGEIRTDLRDDTAGLGDVLLSGALRLAEADTREFALRVGVKLPTGDSDRLFGSGGTDLSARLAVTDAATLEKWDVTLFGSAGVVRLGNGDVLEDLRRRWVGTGNLGFAWQIFERMALKAQADLHTAVFRDSALDPIDSWAMQVMGGFSFLLPGETVLDLAISENIVVETAPDVAFHLSVGKRF